MGEGWGIRKVGLGRAEGERRYCFEAGGRRGGGRHSDWLVWRDRLLGKQEYKAEVCARRSQEKERSGGRGWREGSEWDAPAGWAFLLLCLVPAGPRPAA